MAEPAATRPTFPTALRLLFAGDVVTAAGVGLTQPYLVVLLHSVRGVPSRRRPPWCRCSRWPACPATG